MNDPSGLIAIAGAIGLLLFLAGIELISSKYRLRWRLVGYLLLAACLGINTFMFYQLAQMGLLHWPNYH